MDLYLLMASSTAIYHQKGQPRSLCKVVLIQILARWSIREKEKDLNKTNLQSLMGIPRTKFWADEGARRRHRSFSQPLRNTTELPWICTFWWRHRQQSIIKKVSREVCARWLSAPISAFCIPYWGTSPPKVTEALSIQELQWGYLWGWLVVEFDQGWTIIRCLLPSSSREPEEKDLGVEVPGDLSILPLCRTTEAKSPSLSVKILVIENYTKKETQR